jgi:hypothetical protein
MKKIAAVAALTVLAGSLLPTAHADPAPTQYVVGFAARTINPNADGSFGGEPVYLGGYGFTNGSVTGDTPRTATGILGPGVTARAFIVATDDDPAHALVLASLETQGYFAGYQQGPYGLEDMRKAAASTVGIPAERIIISGNHTHAGPDTIGVWGGVPTPYLAYIKDQMVGAVADAWANRTAATLWLGTTDATDIQSNQFSTDPNNQVMDHEMRVLQARDSGGEPVATLVNLSIHPTVMGGDNRLVSADWPGPAQEKLAAKYGGGAVAVVGSLGRSQPNDGPSYAECAALDGLAQQYCALDHYSDKVVAHVEAALAGAQPLTGPAVVDGHSYYLQDVAHNALLLGLAVAGGPVGAPISRSITPPWEAGPVVGTVTFSARVGSLLFSGGPGELYPQIPAAVAEATGVTVGHPFVIGLAGDQLGYILAPVPDAYPEPIRRSFLSGEYGDPTTWQPSPIDNDNYFFNVSHTLGERVICSLLRGAGDVFATGTAWRDARTQCLLFPNDMLNPPGADVTASS